MGCKSAPKIVKDFLGLSSMFHKKLRNEQVFPKCLQIKFSQNNIKIYFLYRFFSSQFYRKLSLSTSSNKMREKKYFFLSQDRVNQYASYEGIRKLKHGRILLSFFRVLTDSVKNNTQVLINCRNNKKLLGRVKAFDRFVMFKIFFCLIADLKFTCIMLGTSLKFCRLTLFLEFLKYHYPIVWLSISNIRFKTLMVTFPVFKVIKLPVMSLFDN